MNSNISKGKIFLVSDDGNSECSIEEGLKKAKEMQMELIEVGNKDGIPVCKIMDYNKYRFQQKKKKKPQKVAATKEIQIGFSIDKHDLLVKLKKADKLLQSGCTVKIMIICRGRESSYISKASGRLQEYVQEIQTPFVIKGNKIETNNNKTWVTLQPVKKSKTR